MLPHVILGLLATLATAAPSPVEPSDARGPLSIEPDGREVYTVVGNATDAAIWDRPDEAGVSSRDLESRQVNYRCFSTGKKHTDGWEEYVRIACDSLYGGFATNQEKKRCVNRKHDGMGSDTGSFNFAILNTVGGRGHEWDACVDRLQSILYHCDRGGRVNRANWEMLADPNSGWC